MDGQQSEGQQLSVPYLYDEVGKFRLAYIDDFIKSTDYGNILPNIRVHNGHFGNWKIFQNENGWLFIIPSFCEWIISDYEKNPNQYFWAVRESNGTIHKGRKFTEFTKITKIPTHFNNCLWLSLNMTCQNSQHATIPTYTLEELGF